MSEEVAIAILQENSVCVAQRIQVKRVAGHRIECLVRLGPISQNGSPEVVHVYVAHLRLGPHILEKKLRMGKEHVGCADVPDIRRKQARDGDCACLERALPLKLDRVQRHEEERDHHQADEEKKR